MTLDLEGFAIEFTGSAPAETGVQVNAIVEGLTISNGTVRGWTLNGIYAATASSARFEDLALVGNGNFGLVAGGDASVRAIIAQQDGWGVSIAPTPGRGGALVLDSTLSDNTNIGLDVDSSATVRNNAASGNQTGIVVRGSRNRIEANSAVLNTSTGVLVLGTDNVIIRNSASGNVAQYDIGPGNTAGPIVTSANIGTDSNPHANYVY